jgi:hypothetical protein
MAVLGAAWPDPQRFDPETKALLGAIGELCAATLQRLSAPRPADIQPVGALSVAAEVDTAAHITATRSTRPLREEALVTLAGVAVVAALAAAAANLTCVGRYFPGSWFLLAVLLAGRLGGVASGGCDRRRGHDRAVVRDGATSTHVRPADDVAGVVRSARVRARLRDRGRVGVALPRDVAATRARQCSRRRAATAVRHAQPRTGPARDRATRGRAGPGRTRLQPIRAGTRALPARAGGMADPPDAASGRGVVPVAASRPSRR